LILLEQGYWGLLKYQLVENGENFGKGWASHGTLPDFLDQKSNKPGRKSKERNSVRELRTGIKERPIISKKNGVSSQR